MNPKISVVTPTLGRPEEVAGLLENLTAQTVAPVEHILVDAAESGDMRTEDVITQAAPDIPWPCYHIRNSEGTAIQRNVGIDQAVGDYVLLIDDDIRLDSTFLAEMIQIFEADKDRRIGGIAGYITNQHLDPTTSPRWRWYRRLRVFSTYEPGRYDYQSGYPINRYLQPPHDGQREIDFMGTSCAVWRREVFDRGLRFSRFFTGYGVLEDAHFALKAGREWKLIESGRATCQHLRSPLSRVDNRRLGQMTAVNYRFVFKDLVPERTLGQEFRFWRIQALDLVRYLAILARRPSRDSIGLVVGKIEGIVTAARLTVPAESNQDVNAE